MLVRLDFLSAIILLYLDDRVNIHGIVMDTAIATMDTIDRNAILYNLKASRSSSLSDHIFKTFNPTPRERIVPIFVRSRMRYTFIHRCSSIIYCLQASEQNFATDKI